ncbi:MAG: primosomal replication protein N [Burkholderiaceae bacterium]
MRSTPANANCLVLSASVVQIHKLRYTPAGLPALNLALEHGSVVREADSERTISANIKAVVVGDLALILAQQAVGTQAEFKGFLASTLRSKTPVFHIQSFQLNH